MYNHVTYSDQMYNHVTYSDTMYNHVTYSDTMYHEWMFKRFIVPFELLSTMCRLFRSIENLLDDWFAGTSRF